VSTLNGPTVRKTLFIVAGLLALAMVVVRLSPSGGGFLYVPHKAELLASHVRVPGEKEQTGNGGIYFVDISIRRANLLERILPAARPEGSTLVDDADVVPEGSSFEEETKAGKVEMARSEEIASAVALRAASYEVQTKARGVLIDGVYLDAPSGRELRRGDVIVSAAGKTIRTPSQLRKVMERVKPGESVALDLRRGDKDLKVAAKTLANPAEPSRAFIGIRVAQDAEIDLPLEIDIDLGDVGGPSAGLPFALEVLDELGTEVDRGYKVAATGEIEIDGTVNEVGGIKQKTYGVRQAGADIFLVPAGDNAEEARRYAGNLRIVPVENFQQALRFLETLPEKR